LWVTNQCGEVIVANGSCVTNQGEEKNKAEIAKLIDDDKYEEFFITTIPFKITVHKSFYDDSYFHNVIEGKGGRINKKEIEKISLRIVSKTPDTKLKSFFTALQKALKASNKYGMGIENNTTASYKNYYYNIEIVKNRTAWFDLKAKEFYKPIEFNTL
jgi:hypothetical protein